MPYTSPFACYPEQKAFEALRVSLGVDYISYRWNDGSGGVVQTSDQAGEPCKSASNQDACTTALAEANSNTSLFSTVGSLSAISFLVVTQGDDVIVVGSRQAMLDLFGSIDSPAKAYFIARQGSYQPTCDSPWIAEVDGSWILRASRIVKDCPIQYADVVLRIGRDGTVSEVERTLRAETNSCAGRRPEGLVPAMASASSVVGSWFATMAHLEAASVHAFRVLRDELVQHGAPKTLVARAERAMRDEVRHAAMMGRFARRHGAAVAAVVVAPHAHRSLEEMALENAREGCVRELYGALEASWQAASATDPELAQTMKTIADDETRHAELSLDVAEWLSTKLDAVANARIAAVRIAAFRELADEVARGRSSDLERVGLPNAAEAAFLVERLESALAVAA
ncbi:putative lipoprotein [Labilithrix luteola]|uniref:Putative lipoprotein n=1 Tax=Labilithrix luteola TaxID=1391654 RepID=A0A0K1Q6A4_9BACT|nr:ferritin-like domain-containing protein [Labilithrix luteola]AKV01361.1 putative lipoprotein [Labilithrix luteola]